MAAASLNTPSTCTDTLSAAGHYAPSTARGRATRQRLLDAAVAEFGEKGFHAASVSAITTRAGIGQGTFYIYFASKDACYAVAAETTSRALRRTLLRAFGSHNLDAALRASFGAYLDFCGEHRMAMRSLDEAASVAPAIWRGHRNRLQYCYADLLDRHASQRRASMDRDVEAAVIVGALQATTTLAVERAVENPTDINHAGNNVGENVAAQAAEALTTMLLCGIDRRAVERNAV